MNGVLDFLLDLDTQQEYSIPSNRMILIVFAQNNLAMEGGIDQECFHISTRGRCLLGGHGGVLAERDGELTGTIGPISYSKVLIRRK